MLINISGHNLKIKNIKKDLNGVERKLLDIKLAKKYGWISDENILNKLKETYHSYNKS